MLVYIGEVCIAEIKKTPNGWKVSAPAAACNHILERNEYDTRDMAIAACGHLVTPSCRPYLNFIEGTKPEQPILTNKPMSEEQGQVAEEVAKLLGYKQTAYTSSSGLWGLNCIADRQTQKEGMLINTEEYGLVMVMTLEDMRMPNLAAAWKATCELEKKRKELVE